MRRHTTAAAKTAAKDSVYGANVHAKMHNTVIHPESKYPCRMSMYTDPPTWERITIEDFEIFAVERIQVLTAIESARARNKRGEEMDEAIRKVEARFMPLHPNMPGFALEEERRKDHVSHFILRLSYARTMELRRWFLEQETALFRYRFSRGSQAENMEFLNLNGIHFVSLLQSEKENMKEQLQFSYRDRDLEKFKTDIFYKVPYEEAIDLIRRRAVYVEEGFGYVPHSELTTLCTAKFRRNLEQALEMTAKRLPDLEEDSRLTPILEQLGRIYLGSEYSGERVAGTVTAKDVETLAPYFPLCMKNLHQKLKQDHHLKHFGRLQFGLYLKGIGLSMEEALLFWKRAFTPRVSEEQFQKQYAYSIRHSFGREGSRKNYPPLSCSRIIMNNSPGQGDHHGCPFRHFSADNLRKELSSPAFPRKIAESHGEAAQRVHCLSTPRPAEVNEIMDLVRGQHYQIACTRYFEVTNRINKPMDTINHPNEYFDNAMAVSGMDIRSQYNGRKGGIELDPSSSDSVAMAEAAAAIAAADESAPTPPSESVEEDEMEFDEDELQRELDNLENAMDFDD